QEGRRGLHAGELRRQVEEAAVRGRKARYGVRDLPRGEPRLSVPREVGAVNGTGARRKARAQARAQAPSASAPGENASSPELVDNPGKIRGNCGRAEEKGCT